MGATVQNPVAGMVHVVHYACLQLRMGLMQPTPPIDSLRKFGMASWIQSQDARVLQLSHQLLTT